MENRFGKENQDVNILLPSAAVNRRSSIFDGDAKLALERRKTRMDSMVSFTSDSTDFDRLLATAASRRSSKGVGYENTFQLEPLEKPKLGEIKESIDEVLRTTCQELEYEYIMPCDVIKNVNSAVHKRLKHMVPMRYKFTCQSILIEQDECDMRIRSKWLWASETDCSLTVKYTTNPTLKVVTICHFLYHE